MSDAIRAGRAEATLAELHRALAAEAVAAVAAGGALLTLRDPSFAVGAGSPSLVAHLAALPPLDRAGARRLARAAEAAESLDPDQAGALGFSRLLLLGDAPPAIRAGLRESAASMTLTDLRRALRDAGATRSSADPLAALRLEGIAAEDARRMGREAGRTLAAALRELMDAALRAARAAERLEREGLYAERGADDLSTLLLREAGLSRGDAAELLALAARSVEVALPVRERIGIRGLRALCRLDDDALRGALAAAAAADPAMGAEALLTRIRAATTAAAAPDAPESAEQPAAERPAPMTSPFDALYLVEAPSADEAAIDATPVAIVEQLLLRATAAGDAVVDLTAGRGTVAAVGARLGRRVTSIDLIDPPLAAGIAVGDARTARPAGGPFRLAVVHPPIGGGERFITERFAGRTLPGDLSVVAPEGWAAAVGEIIANAAALVAPGGEVAVICRPQHLRGRYHDWPTRLAALAEAAGLEAVDHQVAVVDPATRLAREQAEVGRATRERRTVVATLHLLRFRRPSRA